MKSLAQTGRYQLRLVQESVDCAQRTVVFSAQIRASSADSAFILGSSNLPLTFNPVQLANPQLISADNFSGGRYSQLSLNQQGSVLTLNITYQGTAPYTDTPNVTSAWKSIAHIAFTIPAQADGCYALTWNTENDFPGTEVFEVVIQGGGYTEQPIAQDTFFNTAGCALASQLPVATLSGDTTIYTGEQATLNVDFNGITPISVSLNGITYSNLTQPPLLVNVFPAATTTYTIDSVFNACGKGTVQGSATVTVLSPTISTLDLTQATVCAGATIQVPFTTQGVFGSGNTLRVQLSDAAGANFADIPGSGSASPLTAIIPANTPSGAGYRVRVVSSDPAVTGTASGAFAVSAAPTATLTGGAAIPTGGSASLTVTLTGKAPWTVTLSDTSVYTFAASPAQLSVSPDTTTTYSLLSVTDACTSGTVSGSAEVTLLTGEAPCQPVCVPVTYQIIKL